MHENDFLRASLQVILYIAATALQKTLQFMIDCWLLGINYFHQAMSN